MLRISAAVHKMEMAWDEKLGKLFFRHPYLGVLFVGIVAPIVALIAVALGACTLALPVGLIVGWL